MIWRSLHRTLREQSLGNGAPVRASVAAGSWPSVSAHLVEWEPTRVALALPAELPLPLEPGQEVDVTLWLERPARVVQRRGLVRGVVELSEARRVDIDL